MASSPIGVSIISQFFPRSSRPTLQASALNSSNVTTSPNIPRTRLGPAKIYLRQELANMYWKGIERELAYVLLTLKRWQQQDCLNVVLNDEEDDFIHGYDTFLDQVSHSSRGFTQIYNDTLDPRPSGLPTYEEALLNRSWGFMADQQSIAVRQEIRSTLDERARLPLLKRRARMLLQAGGWLDIDKVIEYRDPEKLLSFWKRPAVPQLSLRWSAHQNLAEFVPQYCSTCKKVIRGSSFCYVGDVKKDAICESCYRKTAYGSPNLVKVYKRCALRTEIATEMSHAICRCISVPRIDSHGRSRAPFPVDSIDQHLNATRPDSSLRCALFELNDLVAEAKYESTLTELDRHVTLKLIKRTEEENRVRVEQETKKAAEKAKKKGMGPVDKTHASLVNTNTTVAELGKSTGITEQNYEEIPSYLRPIAGTYPLGNVHMALRIGPLVIENGVSEYANQFPPFIILIRP